MIFRFYLFSELHIISYDCWECWKNQINRFNRENPIYLIYSKKKMSTFDLTLPCVHLTWNCSHWTRTVDGKMAVEEKCLPPQVCWAGRSVSMTGQGKIPYLRAMTAYENRYHAVSCLAKHSFKICLVLGMKLMWPVLVPFQPKELTATLSKLSWMLIYGNV